MKKRRLYSGCRHGEKHGFVCLPLSVDSVVTEKCPGSEHYGVCGVTRLGERPLLERSEGSVHKGANPYCPRLLGRV